MLFSASKEKERLFRLATAPQDKVRRIGKVENDFYAQEAVRQSDLQERDVPDGLIFPYKLDYNGFKLPLPVAVTLIKANEARNSVAEDLGFNETFDFGIVNDAIWAIGDGKGNLEEVINKTDPYKNHDEDKRGDVQRLANFFSSQGGRYFYSVGSTARVDAKEGAIEMTIGSLRVGRIKPLAVEEFLEIFGVDLRTRGAFSLDFVLDEGFLNVPKRFVRTVQLVEITKNGAVFSGRTETLIPNKIQSIRKMQRAAHGIPFEGF